MQQNSDSEIGLHAERRYPAAALRGITGVRLSPGDVVTLINISNSGILVEGKTRFVPATRVAVVFEGAAALGSVNGRIVRCHVSAVGGGKLLYQSAITFDNKIDLHIEETTTDTASQPAAPKKADSSIIAPIAAGRPAGVYNRW